jgi:hypothetical protein
LDVCLGRALQASEVRKCLTQMQEKPPTLAIGKLSDEVHIEGLPSGV